MLTSGDEILTFLAFSVRMRLSSTYDSRKSVWRGGLSVRGTGPKTGPGGRRGTHLDIVLGKLLGQGASTSRGGIDCVIDGDLAVLMVEPAVDVLATPLQDLLAKHDRSRRRVGKEVVFRDIASRDSGTTVVSQMEDARLDAQPDRVRKGSGGGMEKREKTYQPR